MRLLTPENLTLAGACAGAWWLARDRHKRDPFPTDLRVTDPVRSREGAFHVGHYLPDEGEDCIWDPWGGGEQHLGIFGTTNAGKTVVARLLAVTAKENWGWDVVAADGAKGGIDFTFMRDADIGRVVSGAGVEDLLDEVADDIETRGNLLRDVRVRRDDPAGGPSKAVAPQSLRDLSMAERREHGLTPRLVIIDELAILLSTEGNKKPITKSLLRILAAGRFVGIHLVAVMQRGDADLLSGFLGNLLRARVLVGATDQTAENMAHGAGPLNLWRELMGARGWEPDGMERALRPPGRAFVSGLAPRAPGLAQMFRFDPVTRAPLWDEYVARRGAGDHGAQASPTTPADPPVASVPSPVVATPPLSLVPDDVRASDYAENARAGSPRESEARPPSAPRLRVV